ncbi:MAG: hypothetical protein CMJ75_13090 [Planctomycetaceae bacterium]|nr:hypothetical protein [Planctomycetaceae bacterium]
MLTLPNSFPTAVDVLVNEAMQIDGWTTPRELRFLALLAACPTTPGAVLEIGSYRGRSTTLLARANQLVSSNAIVAVDHLLQEGACEAFQETMRTAGVEHLVEFHQMMSWELALGWDRPLRLLWIDGNHSYESTHRDLASFAPSLADGAIVAIDDVLNRYEGSLRVFLEDILLSPHFGAAGVCGSIGWAQFHADSREARGYHRENLKLYRRLSPLVPLVAFDCYPSGWDKLRYRLLRSRVPRRMPAWSDWMLHVCGPFSRHSESVNGSCSSRAR